MAKGFTQQYVGEKLGISQNAYSKIEIGKSIITVERLCQIAEIFEIDLKDLIIL